jgi:hypothetical protein
MILCTRRQWRQQMWGWYMEARDEAYLNYCLWNPAAHAMLSGFLSAFTPDSPVPMFALNGHAWDVSFTTHKKRAGLRVATLNHPRLNIVLREQNPFSGSESAGWATAGYQVFQLYVDGQPRVRIVDGTGAIFDGTSSANVQRMS